MPGSYPHLDSVVVVSEDLVVAAAAVLGERAGVVVGLAHPGGDGAPDPEHGLHRGPRGAGGEDAAAVLGHGLALALVGLTENIPFKINDLNLK